MSSLVPGVESGSVDRDPSRMTSPPPSDEHSTPLSSPASAFGDWFGIVLTICPKMSLPAGALRRSDQATRALLAPGWSATVAVRISAVPESDTWNSDPDGSPAEETNRPDTRLSSPLHTTRYREPAVT